MIKGYARHKQQPSSNAPDEKPARRVKNTKAKGSYYEKKSQKWLEAGGFQVSKSAASLGPFDLIAWNDKVILFIQVKFGRWPDPAEREKLDVMPVPPAGHKLVHRWEHGGQQSPAVRLVEEFRRQSGFRDPRVYETPDDHPQTQSDE